MSESCHVLVTATLKIWVVFSGSHGAVSLAVPEQRELSQKSGQDGELLLDTGQCGVVGTRCCRKWCVTAEGEKHQGNNRWF